MMGRSGEDDITGQSTAGRQEMMAGRGVVRWIRVEQGGSEASVEPETNYFPLAGLP